MDVPVTPSTLFLREEELRRGLDLLFFAHRDTLADPKAVLTENGLGNAHYRALYFIARQPGITVSGLLDILQITKQSLGRVLNRLIDDGLVDQTSGLRDRRQRHLALTADGIALETALFQTQRDRLAEAYNRAGVEAVAGFWQVLWHLTDVENRDAVLNIEAR